MNFIICILIVVLIIIMFFVGYAIGLSTPFLLKKYFNISESNLNQLNDFKQEYSSEIEMIHEEIKNLDVINDIEELKNKIETLSKSKNDENKEIINEWFYGNPNGGDINGTS